jgi:hypothetical protein
VTKFVEPLVELPFSFTDVHQEVFAGRADAIEAGFFGDFPELFFGCGEGDPRGPGLGAPGGGEVLWIGAIYFRFRLVGIGRHA